MILEVSLRRRVYGVRAVLCPVPGECLRLMPACTCPPNSDIDHEQKINTNIFQSKNTNTKLF